MRSWPEIADLTAQMMRERSLVLQKMRDVQNRYEGDYVIPIPDVDKEPKLPALAPALIGEAVDKTAQRAASVEPLLSCPAVNPMLDRGPRSLQYASIRRRAIQATYHDSKWMLGRRKAYRQLAAYATTSIVVLPDFARDRPRLEVRDPLATFVETVSENELRPPSYGAFVTLHSGAKLRSTFPATKSENNGPITPIETDQQWEIIEWFDDEQIVFGLLGPVFTQGRHIDIRYLGQFGMQISPAFPNRLGVCPIVTPANVALNRIASRLSTMIGNVDLQSKLMALDIIAQEKAIFPDVYAIGRQGGTPQIVGGMWKDGRDGDINRVTDVEQIGVLRQTPDQRTQQIIDRLERNFRVSNNLSPQYGGESYGSLRTGRALDTMAGMSIDPNIQELHEVMMAWMPHVNAAVFGTFKGYWGAKKYSMYTGWPGDTSTVEFVPDKHFEIDESAVNYPIPGADVVQQTQILGSLLGTGTLSHASFQAMHPWIKDPEAERRLLQEEQFEDAAKQSLISQLANGQMPLPVASIVARLLGEGKTIFEAIEAADEEIRRKQATAAPAPPEGMMMPPEAMPGMAAGPAMMQQPMAEPAPQVEVPGDVERMKQLMSTMAAS